MCGFCGLARPTSDIPIDEATLLRMRDTLIHRGPDGSGVYVAPSIALAHRRLSIIDLSDAGQQPMPNEDRTVWVVYNGEVYNFQPLRRELEGRGHRFRSRTDSEVLVHMYEEWGEGLVDRLRGMFAFAIWDCRSHRLLLARDRFGIKPLYYARLSDGGVVFGSEVKAILASGVVCTGPDPFGVTEYLANRYTTGDRTMYAGVHRLESGSLAIWQRGTLWLRRYWEPRTGGGRAENGNVARLVGEFRRRFVEAVTLRMISDAPIGVFLSGGVDSSGIAAVMARNAPAAIRTFSVGFGERGANELAYAREVSQALATEHREVLVTSREFFDALPKLIWHEDEPIAFASSVPLYFVSRLAARDVKVVLTGEGSDELLGGYGRYWRTVYNMALGARYAKLPAAVRHVVRKQVLGLPDSRLAHRLRRTFLVKPSTVEGLYLENFCVFDGGMQRELLDDGFREAVDQAARGTDPFDGHRRILDGMAGETSVLERLLALDQQTYLQELLMKQDQMSMAASVESRVPFLDHEFAQFVWSLPSSLKVRGVSTKRILRSALRGLVPDTVLRRRKMGFPTPVGAWMRGDHEDMVRELLQGSVARQRGIFRQRYVDQLLREHGLGRVDHTERLWVLLNIELWFRACLDGAGATRGVP